MFLFFTTKECNMESATEKCCILLSQSESRYFYVLAIVTTYRMVHNAIWQVLSEFRIFSYVFHELPGDSNNSKMGNEEIICDIAWRGLATTSFLIALKCVQLGTVRTLGNTNLHNMKFSKKCQSLVTTKIPSFLESVIKNKNFVNRFLITDEIRKKSNNN